MYKCEILADSMNPQGDRITTFRLTYPRIIHAELMTHRMFSRNSASSRAIPFKKMVKMVEEDPFIPLVWQKDHKGMQGSEYATYPDTEDFKSIWLEARDNAIKSAQLAQTGKVKLTKQLCNRLLEPFMWHTVLVTATEYDNFFELRCPQYKLFNVGSRPARSRKDWLEKMKFSSGLHPSQYPKTEEGWWKLSESGADIHIQTIAEMMWDAYNESTPKKLEAGEWHIPFGDGILIPWKEGSNLESNTQETIKIATARCARISYETLGDNPKIDYEADIKLHDRLLLDKHLSCFEHCARAMSNDEYETFVKGRITRVGCEIERYDKGDYSEDVVIKKDIQGWCNNFKGFIQYRYLSK